jgi:hypothetical protein
MDMYALEFDTSKGWVAPGGVAYASLGVATRAQELAADAGFRVRVVAS